MLTYICLKSHYITIFKVENAESFHDLKVLKLLAQSFFKNNCSPPPRCKVACTRVNPGLLIRVILWHGAQKQCKWAKHIWLLHGYYCIITFLKRSLCIYRFVDRLFICFVQHNCVFINFHIVDLQICSYLSVLFRIGWFRCVPVFRMLSFLDQYHYMTIHGSYMTLYLFSYNYI